MSNEDNPFCDLPVNFDDDLDYYHRRFVREEYDSDNQYGWFFLIEWLELSVD